MKCFNIRTLTRCSLHTECSLVCIWDGFDQKDQRNRMKNTFTESNRAEEKREEKTAHDSKCKMCVHCPAPDKQSWMFDKIDSVPLCISISFGIIFALYYLGDEGGYDYINVATCAQGSLGKAFHSAFPLVSTGPWIMKWHSRHPVYCDLPQTHAKLYSCMPTCR